MKKILLKVVGVSGWIAEQKEFEVDQLVTAEYSRKGYGYNVYDLIHENIPFSVHVSKLGDVYIPGISNLKLKLIKTRSGKMMKTDTITHNGIPVDKRRCRRLFRQVSKITIRLFGHYFWKKAARNHRR